MHRLKNRLKRYWQVATAALLITAGSIAVYRQVGIDESTFLGIFIPATLGVLGSYALYLKRNADTERHLRKALCSELEGMILFQVWPTNDGTVPTIDVFATSVYDQNTDSIGLLTEREITHVVEFYSRVYTTKNLLGFHRDKTIQSNSSYLGQDLSKKGRIKSIVHQLDVLTLSHHRALLTLRRHVQEEVVKNRPTLAAETTIAADYPVIGGNIHLCIEYGLLESVSDTTFRVTDKGDAFFNGDLTANKLEKEQDVLGRDENWFNKVKNLLIS